jgi:hypothetical protein
MNLRIVISCVSFETVKVLDPIFYYKADKAYLIYSSDTEPYVDFYNEVSSKLNKKRIPFEPVKIYYSDFDVVLKNVRRIIKKENEAGNHVYVNLGAGPQIYSSAAMIASMMEGAIPFYAPTKDFTVDKQDIKDVFYIDDKPVGNTKTVDDPKEIPLFKIQPPDPDLVKALSIWKEVTEKIKIRPTKDVILELYKNGMLDKIWEDDRELKQSQSALMRYRRKYLERFEGKKWIEKKDRGEYIITEEGKRILDVFL